MPNPFTSFFSRKKPQQAVGFKEYYTNWFNTLTNNLLPLMNESLSWSSTPSTLVCSHNDLLLQHLLSYYDTLDLAATQDHLPQLLFPSWRNSLEVPFLFLGDLHPYLFTNLLRSFLEQEDEDEEEEEEEDDDMSQSSEFLDRPWQVVMAWKDVSKSLMSRVEQIECGLRLMVPALTDRIKKVQGGFVGRVAADWVGFCEGKREGVKLVIEEAMKEEMEELVTVFMDANRLRKSVITEIVGALTVYQAALFLEALAQFLVGFRDPDLVAGFKRTNNFAITGGLHLGF